MWRSNTFFSSSLFAISLLSESTGTWKWEIFFNKLIDTEEESKVKSQLMFKSTRDSYSYMVTCRKNKEIEKYLEEKVVKINISEQKPDDKN